MKIREELHRETKTQANLISNMCTNGKVYATAEKDPNRWLGQSTTERSFSFLADTYVKCLKHIRTGQKTNDMIGETGMVDNFDVSLSSIKKPPDQKTKTDTVLCVKIRVCTGQHCLHLRLISLLREHLIKVDRELCRKKKSIYHLSSTGSYNWSRQRWSETQTTVKKQTEANLLLIVWFLLLPVSSTMLLLLFTRPGLIFFLSWEDSVRAYESQIVETKKKERSCARQFGEVLTNLAMKNCFSTIAS